MFLAHPVLAQAPYTPPVTAAQIIENYHQKMSAEIGAVKTTQSCKQVPQTDDIVVCGKSYGDSPRLPLPNERGEPGDRRRLSPGEAARASDTTPAPVGYTFAKPHSITETFGKLIRAARGD